MSAFSAPACRYGQLSARTAIVVATLAAGAAIGTETARAAYPDRPVKIVVPFAPGGGSDLVARVLSGPLSQIFGQSVFVENRPGANGNVGISMVARAEPDGYTLLLASSVFVVNPSLTKGSGYDPVKDFAPIAYLGSSPNVIVTKPDPGLRTVQDLIAKAKANPDAYNFATPGVGSISQLGAELLKIRTGIRMVHVPYIGAGPATQAALAGTTQLASVNISAVIPQIKAGLLTALVQTGKERWPDLMDVPTLDEVGVTDAASETFQSLLAPAGTPQPIIDRLAAEVAAIFGRPEIRDQMQKAGFGVAVTGPDALRALIAKEVPLWRDVLTKADLKAE